MGRVKTPTLQQKRFIKAYIQTGSPIKAAEIAYPNTKRRQSLSANASNNLNHSPAVRKYLYELLDAEGLTDEKIAHQLNKIVDAGTTTAALRTAGPKDAMSALRFAADLKDITPAKRIEQKTASLNVRLEGKNEEDMGKMLQSLSTEISQFQKMISTEKKRKENEGFVSEGLKQDQDQDIEDHEIL
jgi:hypothetical protein